MRNKFEIDCFSILEARYPGQFRYVGDKSLLINRRSPDYIDQRNKIVVLCHGLYWHMKKFGIHDTPAHRRWIELRDAKPFNAVGYDAWFIWENDITTIGVVPHG